MRHLTLLCSGINVVVATGLNSDRYIKSKVAIWFTLLIYLTSRLASVHLPLAAATLISKPRSAMTFINLSHERNATHLKLTLR